MYNHYFKGQAPSNRQAMLAKAIRNEIALLAVRGELLEYGISGEEVTITGSNISRDLKNASVFVHINNFLNSKDSKENGNSAPYDLLLKNFENAKHFIRSKICAAMSMRYVPQLYFKRDHSIDALHEIDVVIRSLSN
ncbi:Ribosome-binding factor A [Candidatus Fokinia solitaria]|uniref:Ribosome-binding factor A n=1 Tax=Candidatus Fokinia solitaria TaxID=1802984 RepID=A0A2U8BT27_9RICK|nr:ribosome-binding factor A [Candidatus Fokinia solitaria]AWD33521.1 Ribosome-binding factor A [Candidatus Fokinia solitaria]